MKFFKAIFLCILALPAFASDAFHTDAFGVVPLSALSKDRATWSDVAANSKAVGGLAETVQIFAGPKSIVAGSDKLHLVAFAVDQFGNLVKDGTEAGFTVDERPIEGTRTRAGIASVQVNAGTVTGTFIAGATVDSRQSARAVYRVTADLSSLEPAVRAMEAPIDIESLATMSSVILADRFGNRVEDGLSGQLTVMHGDGAASFLPAVTVEGRAKATLLTRDLPSGGSITATIAKHTTPSEQLELKELKLSAPPAVRVFPETGIDALALRIGPLQTSSGYHLNDGALIAVTVLDKTGKRTEKHGWVFDGRFETLLPISPKDGPFTIKIKTGFGRFESQVSLDHSVQNSVDWGPR